ncbi:MAG TPA: hypothetical protein VLG16_00175 [Candidatus Saccharimonadales bacterium]|nr:hypothetical protein [Candidatus Saccharimonadales bacterium]
MSSFDHAYNAQERQALEALSPWNITKDPEEPNFPEERDIVTAVAAAYIWEQQTIETENPMRDSTLPPSPFYEAYKEAFKQTPYVQDKDLILPSGRPNPGFLHLATIGAVGAAANFVTVDQANWEIEHGLGRYGGTAARELIYGDDPRRGQTPKGMFKLLNKAYTILPYVEGHALSPEELAQCMRLPEDIASIILSSMILDRFLIRDVAANKVVLTNALQTGVKFYSDKSKAYKD